MPEGRQWFTLQRPSCRPGYLVQQNAVLLATKTHSKDGESKVFTLGIPEYTLSLSTESMVNTKSMKVEIFVRTLSTKSIQVTILEGVVSTKSIHLEILKSTVSTSECRSLNTHQSTVSSKKIGVHVLVGTVSTITERYMVSKDFFCF